MAYSAAASTAVVVMEMLATGSGAARVARTSAGLEVTQPIESAARQGTRSFIRGSVLPLRDLVEIPAHAVSNTFDRGDARGGAGLEPGALPGVPGEARRTLELGPGLVEAPDGLEELGARREVEVIAGQLRVLGQRIEESKPGRGPLRPRDRHRAV